MSAEALPAERSVVDAVPGGLLVDGVWHDGGGEPLVVEDPATEQPLRTIAGADEHDATRAVESAAGAFAAFAAQSPRERGELLRRAHDLLLERIDDLALVMTLEMGKPLAESRAEVRYSAAFLRWYAEEAVRIEGRFRRMEAGDGRILTMREPVGPCLLVTPWNFPMAMGARKVAPALAAGCTTVIKPAEQTPLSTLALADVLLTAGVPAGVVNVVPTRTSPEVVHRMLADGRVRKLSFTGSTDVGRRLLEASADQVLRVSMELGGNAPFIVFDDADLDAALEGAIVAKMRNGGAACTAANRFLVAAPLVDVFAERLAARIGAMRVGRGTDPGVEVGPLVDARQLSRVERFVAEARRRAAEVLCGGGALPGPGHFFEPTVLRVREPLPDHEIFGPVAVVESFATDHEAVARANATRYGLVAYVYTGSLDRAFRVAGALETGMVGLNRGLVSNAAAPFGGVKHSGFGREGGPEGVEEYLVTKYIAISDHSMDIQASHR